MRALVSYADFFVVCSGDSTMQVKTIAEHVQQSLGKRGVKKIGLEGMPHAHWVLIDYNDVIVHVFERETREYYQLEKLWLDAPVVRTDEA